METKTIHNGDCVEFMQSLPENCIDMVITSPPFNVGIDYGNGKEADKLPINDYANFANEVMGQVTRVLKHGGRACFELGGSARNLPLGYIWQQAAYQSGLGLYAMIILEHRKTNECAWGSWLKADSVNLVANFRELYVFYKGTEKRSGGTTTIISKEFVEWTKARWQIQWEQHKGHPAPFPSELPERLMKLFGYQDDLVFDPFMGSGTTALAAHKLGRDWLGCELSSKYTKLAQKRIDDALAQPVLPFLAHTASAKFKQVALEIVE